jgi:cytochrome c
MSTARKARNLRSVLLSLLLLAAAPSLSATENGAGPLARQGRALAERMCARCHAVGTSGQSPHDGAPPFRTLSRRVDLDTFAKRLREGLTSGHPDMPTFRFSREDARALTAYLRSIEMQ